MKKQAEFWVKCSICRGRSNQPERYDLFVCNACLSSRGATDPYAILGYWHGCLRTPDRALQYEAYWDGYAKALRGNITAGRRRVPIVRQFPSMNPDDAVAAFTQQRNSAMARGIDWHFDLESWCRVWHDSGKWAERGVGRGSYVMARTGDSGPYAPDNVYITTVQQNSMDAWRNKPVRANGQRLSAHKENEVPHGC